jgi:hypothetical protein
MTVETSLHREVTRTRSGVSSAGNRFLGAVDYTARYKKCRTTPIEAPTRFVSVQRSILHSRSEATRSTNPVAQFRGVAFGPHTTAVRTGDSTRNLCWRPYFLVTWDTMVVPEEALGMLQNKSHSGHDSASGLALDRGYTADSIGDRLIDRAFVYCKNLRCKG